MALSKGTKLGPFEILAPLGAGGMGEVYRARDSRLGREVAIKVLSAAYCGDPERIRRFELEARLVGMLNHPNILVLYDVGTHEQRLYLVTELLEGNTLWVRLREGALSKRKALQYAQKIASGLAAAHDKGITHRDLKPKNIFITRDGLIKILDFGLAKLAATEAGDLEGPTMTAETQPGAVLGTTGYMSPEQVKGQPVDPRSDIFSFGAVLYEMISGRRAFDARTKAEVMTLIMREDPLPLGEPEPVEQLVNRCLEKDPNDRFQSARDLDFAIQGLSSWYSGTGSRSFLRPDGRRHWRDAKFRIAAGMLTALILGMAVSRFLWPVLPPSTGVFHKITYRRGTVYAARFAHDGQTVLYSARWDGRPIETFAVRPEYAESRSLNLVSRLVAIAPAGEAALLREPRAGWLSQWVGMLATVPIGGGDPRDLLDDVVDADYAADGRLAVAIERGDRNRLEFPLGKVLYETTWISHLRVSPRGDRVAFLDHPIPSDDAGSVVMVEASGKKTVLSSGWQSEQGLAWTSRGDKVWFSASRAGEDLGIHAATLSGKVRDVLSGPGSLILQDIAGDGRLLVVRQSLRFEMHVRQAGEARERDLTWLDISTAGDLSKDGKRLLFSEQTEAMGQDSALCIRNTDGSPPVRLGRGLFGKLSPDGKWAIAYIPTPMSGRWCPLAPGNLTVCKRKEKRSSTPDWDGFPTANR